MLRPAEGDREVGRDVKATSQHRLPGPKAAHSRDLADSRPPDALGPPPRVMGQDVVPGMLAGFIPLLFEHVFV
jgi:hypothetical protein